MAGLSLSALPAFQSFSHANQFFAYLPPHPLGSHPRLIIRDLQFLPNLLLTISPPPLSEPQRPWHDPSPSCKGATTPFRDQWGKGLSPGLPV